MPARLLKLGLEHCPAAAEKLDAARVKAMVDDIWEARLQSGDPLENLLHKGEVGAIEMHLIEKRHQNKHGGAGVVH